ncbi:hypothetical protein PtA15_1A144 [Puccinia triticina]|uniref:Uncharacterized protein n=1 Tax=Puccinia triticina TaxID=208348 RepID=A0ABY7C6S2_9BASI|nr:uncharacterized protein PtA15_1A144 [Puccinia triticina]WAQ80806.1 hypothetical protein PtA15_1A144 [Puccinia triticina]
MNKSKPELRTFEQTLELDHWFGPPITESQNTLANSASHHNIPSGHGRYPPEDRKPQTSATVPVTAGNVNHARPLQSSTAGPVRNRAVPPSPFSPYERNPSSRLAHQASSAHQTDSPGMGMSWLFGTDLGEPNLSADSVSRDRRLREIQRGLGISDEVYAQAERLFDIPQADRWPTLMLLLHNSHQPTEPIEPASVSPEPARPVERPQAYREIIDAQSQAFLATLPGDTWVPDLMKLVRELLQSEKTMFADVILKGTHPISPGQFRPMPTLDQLVIYVFRRMDYTMEHQSDEYIKSLPEVNHQFEVRIAYLRFQLNDHRRQRRNTRFWEEIDRDLEFRRKQTPAYKAAFSHLVLQKDRQLWNGTNKINDVPADAQHLPSETEILSQLESIKQESGHTTELAPNSARNLNLKHKHKIHRFPAKAV